MAPIELHRGKGIEREREGGREVTSLKHNGYSCQFIKERGEPRSRTQVIGDKTLPFFEEFK